MVQPISLLMSQFNVENSAQMTKDALAAAQNTAQGQEVVQESVRRVQMVQANDAAAEMQRVRRRNEDEERQDRRRNAQDFYQRSGSDGGKQDEEIVQAPTEPEKTFAPPKGFDLYV